MFTSKEVSYADNIIIPKYEIYKLLLK